MNDSAIAESTVSLSSQLAEVPLVSIGVPTYNRPKGLRRTLTCMTEQSFGNLEIVVSDNCSPDSEVMEILKEFSERDSRIRYFRQSSNIGAYQNFRYVLANSRGTYFMWAADDDEWAPNFIETCLLLVSPQRSVMTGFETVYRATGKVEQNTLPKLSVDKTTFENALAFVTCIQPSLMYGLHPRANLQFFLTGDVFDFYDCYLVLRLVLRNEFTVDERILYRAGVDSVDYEVKLVDQGEGKKLQYGPFFIAVVKEITRCRRLSILNKLVLLSVFSRTMLRIRTIHEKSRHLSSRNRSK